MINKEDLLKELLKNPRIQVRVEETNMSVNQMMDALNIFIDMDEEVDDETTNTLTSFFINEYGEVKRMAILSTRGKRLAYNNNIVTQDINHIDFELLDEFHREDSRKAIVNEFSKYINDVEGHKYGIYIYGEMGIGKTYLLKKFAKILAESGKKVGFVNTSLLLTQVRSTFSTKEGQDEILERLQKVDYLFVDDIGAEKIAAWFRDDFMFPLLNERMEKRKVTFFSSNYSLTQLENHESKTSGSKFRDIDNAKRLVSRIRAVATEMYLSGMNKRY